MQIRLAAADTTALQGLGVAGKAAGFNDQLSITTLVANGINLTLALSGIVLVSLLVYGGFLYLTAAGNPDTVKKSKSLMINAVIGIVIITSAYALSRFVLDAVATAVSGGPAA